MPFQLKKTVAMIGMMGAGKTAIGSALATKLGVGFLDSDAEIEAASNMSIAEIFERFGEAFFREKEGQVIARLLNGPPVILSTGGGAFLQRENRDVISRDGVAIWLDADLELLWSRVRHKTTRPLLRTNDPKATLTEIFNDRRDIYALADMTVKAETGLSIDAMTDRVIVALQQRSDILTSSSVG